MQTQKIQSKNVKKILKNYDLGEKITTKPLCTSGNITYLINSKKSNYLLRLSPSGHKWRSRQEIDAELELINYLRSNNFPTPAPIKTKDGQQIVVIKNHFGYLRDYVNAKSNLNPDLKDIEKFGETFGRFHKLIENYKTKQERVHIWSPDETKKNFLDDRKIILEGSGKQKKRFIDKFEKEISLLKFPSSLSVGMIHEDLGKRHVLWREKEIVGVIDFDRCYFGKLIFDLGQTCRGWCFTNNSKKWKNDNFQALISGYQKQRQITNLEKKYLVDAIKFGVLERSLSFYLRCINMYDQTSENYSMFLIDEKGPLGIIEKNREKIERYLKIV